jgi:glyoxylase-like metal-dependent hydrolase (beta-lactamase superfamily II)
MKIRKILFYIGITLLVCIGMVAIYIYPFYSFFFTPVTTVVSPQFTVISGSGNSSIVKTDSAVLVIDTKMASMAKDLYETVKEIAGPRKIIVINTHLHDDHVHGNYLFTGSKIYIGSYDKAFAVKSIKLKDMPTDFVADSLVLNLGNEEAVLLNIGQAHTFSDLVVYLRKSKTLITGDIVFNKINPALIRNDGTDIEKWMAALDRLSKRWDIRKVVPGHGDAGGPELLSEMIQYFTDMKIAATDKTQADALKKKYDGWRKMPLMSSPGSTIDFINAKH